MSPEASTSIKQLSARFPDEVMAEAETMPEEVAETEKQGRMDVREALTVTIDS